MSEIVTVASLDALKEKLENINTDMILMVVDSNVYNLYRKEFDFINIKNKKVHLWKCLEGEATKQYDEIKNASEFFLSKGIHRKAHLVAFGGGACSDFAGLLASLLLRGLSWSIIPTTLLSMIDASIGGKVAINSEYGKNLFGAFHLPDNIYVYEKFLNSLDRENYQSGLGELIKYCFLDKAINVAVKDNEEINVLIEKCARYKQSITDSDFKEAGHRKVLNLGHTIGHAIERIYGTSHGIAVCWGLVIIFKIFEDEKSLVEMKALIEALGIDLHESPWFNKSFPVDDIMDYISKDKKVVSNDSLEVVLVREIGDIEIREVDKSEVNNRLEESRDELKKFMF